MLVKGKDVIGLKIVTIDDGSVIQTVDDIAYNPNTHRVEALLVSSGGLFSSAKAIHIDDVRNIGEDAVIVPSKDAIKSVKDLGDDVRSISDANKHLVKTNVVTIDGKELGRVTDMYFDSANGNVDSMEVTQGGFKTITQGKKSIKPDDIVTIGADATIVKAYTEAKLDAQGEEGGLKGAFNDAKDKTAEIAASTKDAAEKAGDKITETSRDVAQTVREKTDETRDTLEQKGHEARDKADELAVSARAKADELQDKAADKSVEVRAKANELADDAAIRAEELKVTAKVKADEIADKADELNTKAKEKAEDVKAQNTGKSSTIHTKGREIVERSKEKIEDGAKKVEIEKTKITNK